MREAIGAIAAAVFWALVSCKQAEAPPPPDPGIPPAPDSGASSASCVDAWLAARALNELGDPPGTLYAGGTPLFDERTGERRDRIVYVLAKHPEIAKSCPTLAPDGSASKGGGSP